MITVQQEIRAWAADNGDAPIFSDSETQLIATLIGYPDPEHDGEILVVSPLAAIEYCRQSIVRVADRNPAMQAVFNERLNYLYGVVQRPGVIESFTRQLGSVIVVPGGGGTGLTPGQAALLAQLSGHLTNPNAHHTPPEPSAVGVSQAVYNAHLADYSNHVFDASAHHAPVSLASLMVALVGAELTGNTLTFTRASGADPISVTLPMVGGAVADGTVTSAVINETTNVITLTRSVGVPLTVDLSYLLAEAGLSLAEVEAQIKPFARTGSTTPPLASDIAIDPHDDYQPNTTYEIGQNIAGGVRRPQWVPRPPSSASFFISLTTRPTPTQIAPGGLVASGGHVLFTPADGPEEIWARYLIVSDLVKVATFADHIVRPGDDGMLPSAADNLGRVGIAGSHFYRSVGEQGTDKAVAFKNYGPTRVVLAGEPAKSADELLFAGSVANPPIGNYVLNAWGWDWGSEVWIRNQVHNGAAWVSSAGPPAYHHGNLYQTRGDAAVHVPNATYVGRVYIIGHGNSQKPEIVTGYTAPTAPSAEWIPIGLTIQDVAEQVTAHNGANTAHSGLFQANEGQHNGFNTRLDALENAPAGDTVQASLTPILVNSGHVSNQVSHDVTGWRDYPSLAIVFHDSSEASNNRYYGELNTRVLDLLGVLVVSLEKRAQLIVTRGAGSDLLVLTANTTSTDFAPGSGDTMSFYGLNNGIGPAGPVGPSGTALTGPQIVGLLTALSGNARLSHSALRDNPNLATLVTDIAGKLSIAAYSATATYAHGSANSLVTHGSDLLAYISATQRSNGHDPAEHPNYWSHLNNLANVRVIDNTTNTRFFIGNLLVTHEDECYLTVTNAQASTIRNLAYVKANSGIGGEFINLTNLIPTTWKGPHINGTTYQPGDRVTTAANTRLFTALVETDETPPHADWIETRGGGTIDLNDQEAFREFSAGGVGTAWKEGQLARGTENPHSGWYIVNQDFAQPQGINPSTDDDFSRLLFFKKLTQAQYDALDSGDVNPNVLYAIVG